MKNTAKSIIILLGIALMATENAHAYKSIGNGKKENSNQAAAKSNNDNPPSVLAECSPATAKKDLDINNTRALIHTGGDMWWDLIGAAKYEIPKNSGKTSIFSGALWLGGRDVSGQLKVAGQMYRQPGNDFWTGPLNLQTADLSQTSCVEWDRHFVTFRDTVARFKAWFQAGLDDRENGTTTQQDNFPNFQIDKSILEWPAHGKDYAPYFEDFYLAPFTDYNNDGIYNPLDGDYPAYDFSSKPSCTVGKIDKIYGDMNLWWIFNDKGNAHTNTGSASIGMEIRAQAFAFATSDEVNNMTFYNYELYNRSSYTLTETYFGFFADTDLGGYNDDYVGCDVKKGLGYCYNGDDLDLDDGGAKGYGAQPPAVGIDFFQGPYQDNDGIDNPGPPNYTDNLSFATAFNENGIPYKGIGIGYGDGKIDNERFGMRRFLFFNRSQAFNGDPVNGTQYYNYMRGYWKDGTRMVYGGSGHISDPKANPNVPADYMFPDNTDPIGWGTGGIVMEPWTEVTAANLPQDRRFVQAAGPFTLTPGSTNNITVGVVWAQALTGGALASVEEMRKADDKTQAMFDNCFQVVDGPDAPELSFVEMDRELVVLISNKPISNNYNESYEGTDFFVQPPTAVDMNADGIKEYSLTAQEQEEFNKYKFQGYLVYQVKDASVSTADLKNPEKARLVMQCDVKDGIKKIVNYYLSSEAGAEVPVVEVDGSDNGIVHSFRITEDKFATGDKRLVNHKKVYYIALAYAYNYSRFNDFLPWEQRQRKPFIASRKAATGPIKIFSAIPHKNDMEKGGLITHSVYGDEVELTRIEGAGNGGRILDISQEALNEAVTNNRAKTITYKKGFGPITVKVIDPLNVPSADFHLRFVDSLTHYNLTDKNTRIDSAGYWWYMWQAGKYKDGILSDKAIWVENEQLILQWGLSVTAKQVSYPRTAEQSPEYENDFLGARLSFSNPDKAWLTGIPDADGFSALNWIRSGESFTTDDPITPINETDFDDKHYTVTINTNTTKVFIDKQQIYEKILGGTWAPFALSAQEPHGPMPYKSGTFNNGAPYNQNNGIFQLKYLYSVDIVFTNDKSKWTRCPVLEMQNEPTLSQGIVVEKTAHYKSYNTIPTLAPSKYVKGFVRSAPSVDKDGKPYDTTGFAAMGWKVDSLAKSSNPNDANYISPIGMGWFPGYAVNVETGERLNMAFGEDSWLDAENGNDMIWNPTGKILDEPYIPGVVENWRLGGKHYIFVFRNNVVEDTAQVKYPGERMPGYDAGQFTFTNLTAKKTGGNASNEFKRVYRAAMWVGFPLLAPGYNFKKPEQIPTDATVSIRVSRPFENYGTGEWISYGTKLTPGKFYFVDKGPIIHNTYTFYRGQTFYAKNDSFSLDALNLANGDTINNLVTTLGNAARPYYTFSTKDLAAETKRSDVMNEALKLINVVPNPYFAYSEYETDKLDNRIKIINLPQKCTVTIYTANGTLVRRFTKDDPTITSIDWDLKNTARVPIASGMYLIHVEVPDIGERTLKWMGVMRPIDLDSF